ncbi:MAG: alpha/beta fold hydrolase [Chloroflexota bacterium]
MRRRLFIFGVVTLVIAVTAVYLGVGAYVYNVISAVKPGCQTHIEDMKNSPSAFSAPSDEAHAQADMTGFEMGAYEEVKFPSRDDKLMIDGWYVPAQEVDAADAPAVILVHGLNDCKHSPYMLLPAGMLNRAGFNVLMIDLRDHGDSQVEDGRFAGGTEEYRDALGAWDWLVSEKHIPPEKIGLFGTSLGAATVLIAMGEEPRVAATWEDSSYADIQVAITAELGRYGVPTFFEPGGILMGKILSGDDIAVRSPLAAVSQLNGRPVFITHGDADKRLSVQYAYDLADAINANGGQVEPWIVHGSGHIEAMFYDTADYQQKLVAFFTQSLGR